MDTLTTLLTDPDSSVVFYRLTLPGVPLIVAWLVGMWIVVRGDQRRADEQLRAAIGGK